MDEVKRATDELAAAVEAGYANDGMIHKTASVVLRTGDAEIARLRAKGKPGADTLAAKMEDAMNALLDAIYGRESD
jgi:hypothetical protein